MSWSVEVHPAAADELRSLPPATRRRFAAAIDALADDPYRKRAGVDIKKLGDLGKGRTLHRLRVGAGRSLYAVLRDDHAITILLVDQRGKGYSRMTKMAKRRAG